MEIVENTPNVIDVQMDGIYTRTWIAQGKDERPCNKDKIWE